jgi:hypothetical protein
MSIYDCAYYQCTIHEFITYDKKSLKIPKGISEDKRVSECCLTPSDQLVNYIMTHFDDMLMMPALYSTSTLNCIFVARAY